LVAGGALIGLRSRRQAADKPADPLPPAEAPDAAPAVEASPKREAPTWLSSWQRKLPPDVILLSRDAATGAWVVELEGQRYRRLAEVHDDRAASKILGALEGMEAFAGITQMLPAEPAPPPAPAQPAPVQAGPLPPVLGAELRPARQASYPAPAGSIIAQIETMLQRELALRPEFGERAIHMGALPDGSLVIEVDFNFYKSPNDIPDSRVRDVVMAAVRMWEKSS
jgi:hypothetical protein